MIFIGTVLLCLCFVPVVILVFVRPKKITRSNYGEQLKTIDQNNYDVNSFLPNDEVPITQTGTNVTVIFLYISMASYVTACFSPLQVGRGYDGFGALIFGIITPPLWIPNPVYLIGWALAVRRRYRVAIWFGGIACILAIVMAWGDFPYKQKWVGSFDGPAPVFWVLSMAALVIACVFGLVRCKQHMTF